MPDEPIITPDADDMEFAMELTTRAEYIAGCYNCILAVGEVTTLTAADEKRQKRIIRRCLAILDKCTEEMYDEYFDDRKQVESED